MTDQPAPDSDDLDDTEGQTPKDLYIRSARRVRNLHVRKLARQQGVDPVKLSVTQKLRECEIGALTQLLIDKGLFTMDEYYQAVAEFNVVVGNRMFAELQQPQILVPEGVANGKDTNG